MNTSNIYKHVPTINTLIFNTTTNDLISKAENINPDHHLKEDLYLDSLDHIELVMQLEEKLGIEFKDDGANWKTVQDVYNAVEELT